MYLEHDTWVWEIYSTNLHAKTCRTNLSVLVWHHKVVQNVINPSKQSFTIGSEYCTMFK